jgi:predicted dehydrogenase
MAKKLRWGVIGAGGIADRRTIPEGILKARNAELVAVMDQDAGLAKTLGNKYGVSAFSSVDDLVSHPEVQAVYIATPNFLHLEQAVAAMRQGKHVLCEKPLAITVREIETMIREAKKAQVKLACGYMMRFHAAHQQLATMVRQGALGQLTLGRAQLTCWYPPMKGAWRQTKKLGGGGAFMDMGSHCVDLLESFFGKTKRVHASMKTLVHGYEVEDTSLVTLEFESGSMAVVDNQFNVPDIAARNCLELYGSLGSALCEGTIGQSAGGDVRLFLENKKTGGYAAKQKRSESGGTLLKYRPVNTYQAQIEDLSSAVLDHREPMIGAEEALWNLRVCLAAYQAAKTGKTVQLPKTSTSRLPSPAR